ALAAAVGEVVHIWTVSTGRELRRVDHPVPNIGRAGLQICSVALSKDGQFVASASTPGDIRVASVATGESIDRVGPIYFGNGSLIFRDDRNLVIAGGQSIRFRDVRNRATQ